MVREPNRCSPTLDIDEVAEERLSFEEVGEELGVIAYGRVQVRLGVERRPLCLKRAACLFDGCHGARSQLVLDLRVVGEGVLRLYLREVRSVLGDDAESPKFIETIARRGYRFIAEVKRSGDADDLAPPAQSSIETPSKVAVGREGELARLRSAFLKASTGMRQVIFLSGEAGIGKSTVLEGFIAHASARDGVLIGRGQCVEHRGESEPYLPVIDALGRLCHRDNGGRVAETIRNHAPSWLAQMPALLEEADAPGKTPVAQGATQQRMLREIAEALERLSTYRIVILALEDLHWTDPSTLTLLDLLARRPERARLMIIGTHRPIATLPAEHQLRATVRELVGRYCEDMRLGPLSSSEVAEYLRHRVTETDPADGAALKKVANAIHDRTEGNPLFMVADSGFAPAAGRLVHAGLGRYQRLTGKAG